MILRHPISPKPNRCDLFSDLAADVWNQIVRSHAVNVHVPEVGITNNLITEILHHVNGMTNFDVYARNFKDEPTYGGDLDVFVETMPNCFIWYALQAKVLYNSGDYGKWVKNGANQWSKLRSLSEELPVRSYFLLYNGMDKFKYSGNVCTQSFDERQFGCSLIDVETIETFMSTKAMSYKPKFHDFHPGKALPWRVLTCCMQPYLAGELFTRDEVLQAYDSYANLAENHAQRIDSERNLDKNSNNRIEKANISVGREPDIAIVINTTT